MNDKSGEYHAVRYLREKLLQYLTAGNLRFLINLQKIRSTEKLSGKPNH